MSKYKRVKPENKRTKDNGEKNCLVIKLNLNATYNDKRLNTTTALGCLKVITDLLEKDKSAKEKKQNYFELGTAKINIDIIDTYIETVDQIFHKIYESDKLAGKDIGPQESLNDILEKRLHERAFRDLENRKRTLVYNPDVSVVCEPIHDPYFSKFLEERSL